MSPKSFAITLFVVGLVVGVGPTVPDLVVKSGVVVPHWMKFVGALLLSVCTYVFLHLPAFRQLANKDGGSSSGGPGVTLGGNPSSRPPPPSPPAAARLAWRLMYAWITIGCVAFAIGCPNSTTSALVTGALTQPAQCLMAAILSGTVNFANAATAALQLLSLCAGSTASSLAQLLEDLVAAPDAGIGAPAALPASILAQLPAVAAELRKLPPDMTQADALRALGRAQ